MILICGGLADSVTELVCARLEERGYPYRLLDLGKYPAGFSVNWHWQGAYPTGCIAAAEWKLYLEEVSGVYARYLGAEGRTPLPNVAPELAPAIHMESDTGLVALFEHLPCAVVNRVGGGLSNHSKPYQAMFIRESGLLIPPTLVTSDPERARQFYGEFRGEVIYKSLSGVRSIVRRISHEQLARLPLLKNGPAQFQAFIPGENVRVHTVGDELFATRIRSESVDYRYARREGNTVEMEATELPDAVAEACLDLARRLDLLIAGIDLKVTPEGQYYCFEINPSPGFIFYEQGTGQPISAALADLLRNGAGATVAARDLSYGANAAAMPAL
jgi:glutathione synthase/RimK-type ligase-like ATP-grasp enzyme